MQGISKRLIFGLLMMVMLLAALPVFANAEISAEKLKGGPAFTAENNYMSDYGYLRHIFYTITDDWLPDGIPPAFGRDTHYMSYSGALRYDVFDCTGKWMSHHDAKMATRNWPRK